MSEENIESLPVDQEYAGFISTKEFDQIFDRLIFSLPEETRLTDYRVAAAVIYGYYKGWSPSKTCRYYNVTEEEYKKYSSLFKFEQREVNTKMKTGRKSKQENIVSFLTGNVGKIVTPAQVAEDVNISLPTFYNFYNANRGYFRKVKRGQFEIIDPKTERTNS